MRVFWIREPVAEGGSLGAMAVGRPKLLIAMPQSSDPLSQSAQQSRSPVHCIVGPCSVVDIGTEVKCVGAGHWFLDDECVGVDRAGDNDLGTDDAHE